MCIKHSLAKERVGGGWVYYIICMVLQEFATDLYLIHDTLI